MNVLSSFIPIDRRLALAEGRDLPDRTNGAALFADISGFTALTANLTQKIGSHRAAEEITRQLNQVYTGLIDHLHRFGGAVISFSGDGILCWFDQERPGEPAARAVVCALAMQRFMQALPPAPQSDGRRLYLKVGLASGPARRFAVGDPQIQLIEVLAGAAVDRVALGQRLIQRGEILADATIVAALGERVELGHKRLTPDGAAYHVIHAVLTAVVNSPWPPLPRLPDETATPWLLRPVLERLQHGQGEFLAELRPAAPIFVRFGGIAYDEDDAAGEKLDSYIRWAQAVLARYDGHLLQINMGDKGSYFYAVLGAPVAHEDDPARATAAALALRETPPEFDFLEGVQVGLNLGQIHAGAYGGETRRTYGVIGQPVNVAARLMEQAQPGQLLITDVLFDEAIERAELTALGPVALHGQPVAYPLFALGAARFQPTTERMKERMLAPLVGRQAELAQLTAQLSRLRQGQGGNLIIEGEAGIGKSRLAAELIRLAQAEGVTLLLGGGEAIEQSSAYHGWRPILRTIFGLEGGETTAVMQEKLVAAFRSQPDLLARAPLLNVALPLNLPDNELTSQMTGELRAVSAQNLLQTLIARWAAIQKAQNRPILLLMEDTHWLDSASWALLGQARRVVPDLLLVLITRPVDEGMAGLEWYRQLLTAADTVRLSLTHLSPEEALQLAGQRLGVTEFPPAVAEFIRQRAEGHPFFSEEIAYALRDAGLIVVEDGRCQLAVAAEEMQALNFPNTIHGVVASRIDRLAPAQQLTIKVASVIGRIFPFHTLHDVHPVADDRPYLRDYLSSLSRLDITPLDRPEPESAYVFKHMITQEVAYSLLLFSQRQQLHRAVAEWSEAHYADNLGPYYPLLAHHWGRAEVMPKTVAYLEKAGERALRSSSYKEAIDFFRRVLELAPAMASGGGQRAGQRARWQWKLGEAYYGWGEYSESRRQLTAAAAAYGRPLPGGRLGVAWGIARQVARQVGHRLLPRLFIGRATAENRQRLLETAQIYNWVSRLAYVSNEQALGLFIALRMVNMSELAGPSPELVEGYGVMCVLTSLFQQPRLAEMYYQQALAIAEQVDNSVSRARMLLACGLYHIETGQWETAQRNVTEAVALFDQLGDKRQWGDATAMLASIYGRRGDHQQAIAMYAEMSGPRSGLIYHQILGQIWRGYYLSLQGEMATAVPLLEETLRLLDDNPDEQLAINGWAFLAWCYWRLDQPEAARKGVDEANRLMAVSTAGATFGFPAYTCAAEVCLGLWERALAAEQPAAATAMAAEAKRICAALRFGSPLGRVSSLYCQAGYDWLAGKRGKGVRGWERSAAAAQAMGLPYEEARALYALGRHARQMGHDGRAQLQRARDLFAQLGAIRDQRLVEQLLREAG